MFENFQTENKLRPSFASLLLGTFFPPLWAGIKRLTVFMQAREKEKKLKKTCENSVNSLACFVRR